MGTPKERYQQSEIELLRARLRSLRRAVDETEDLLNRYITAEQALRESEERFRLLVDAVKDYAIFMLDIDGRILSWNSGAQRIKGYTAAEIIGKHFSIFYTSEDKQDGKPARELVIATSEGQYQEEGWRVRKDGALFWAHVLITAVFDERGQLRGFGKVTRDMTERKKAEEERERLHESEVQLERERAARNQAETLLQVRDEFLIATAHELRTPITTLVGYTELLKRRLQQGNVSVERMERPIQAVIEQAQRLDRLTTMLLNLDWLQQGKAVIQRQAVDLRDIVVRVVDGFTPLADQHQLDLSLPSSPLIIEGDELRLEQVFYNLLQNAVKYSPNGGAITIELRAEGQQAQVRISDSGIGIRADDLPFLFDRFYRATNVLTQQISGLGIGLYIVKELLTLHNGTIDVQSLPDRGTTFIVRLPLKN